MAKTKKKIPKLEETPTVREIRQACKELYTRGWQTVHMTYHGSGDECDDFEFSLENAEGTVDCRRVSAADLPPGFNMSKFEQHMWDLLPEGFENNAGGDGEVTIDTATGDINIKHNHYYTESRQTEWGY
jgi:hypothetical protein